MKRNSGYVGKRSAISGDEAKGVFDLHDVHTQLIKGQDAWPAAKTILSVTPNTTTVVENGSELTIQIFGNEFKVDNDVVYYSIETTAGTTMTDADLMISGTTTHTTVDGSFVFTNSYTAPSTLVSVNLVFKFKAEYPADSEGNKFKFRVYSDSARTNLMGESAEVTVTDVAGSASKSVYFTLRENRYGSNMGTISHYLTDTSGNIIHTFGTTSGNAGTTSWQFVNWNTNPDSLAPGTQFHMAWNHAAGSSFRADYAIDEVRLYVDNANVETWGFESTTDGAGTGGFSGYTGWRHANQTNTTNSASAFGVNAALSISNSTGFGIWGVWSGSTGSSGTGPTGAYQGTYYAYTEATSRFSGNHWLFSEVLTVP